MSITTIHPYSFSITVIFIDGVFRNDSDINFQFGLSSGLYSTNSVSTGNGGSINVTTPQLIMKDGGLVVVGSRAFGDAGNIKIEAGHIFVAGVGINGQTTGIVAPTEEGSTGKGGNIHILSDSITLAKGGNVSVATRNISDAGSIEIRANEVNLIDGGQIISTTEQKNGNAGNIFVEAFEKLTISGEDPDFDSRSQPNPTDNISNEGRESGIFANARFGTSGKGGDIMLRANEFYLEDSGVVSAASEGTGNAGQVNIYVNKNFRLINGNVKTTSTESSGGLVDVEANSMRFWGDSDITTSVFSGVGGGGDIRLKADSILAFDDSDILAFSRDGRGGNVFLITSAFFGENFQPAPRETNPRTLDFNNRVDVNASGTIDGLIQLPDVSFIDNSLTDLPGDLVDTDSLLRQSCLAQSPDGEGRFVITGSGGLASRPGDMPVSHYSLEDQENNTFEESDTWDYGDPILEPTGIYKFNNQWIMARECS